MSVSTSSDPARHAKIVKLASAKAETRAELPPVIISGGPLDHARTAPST